MTAKEARIAIYGAGAMGTVLGVMLKKGGLDNVDLITRNEAHVKGMREQGATVVCEADGVELNEKVNAILPSEMQGRYDVIFLMTKQRYNAETLTALLPYLKEDGAVCTTQNGLPELSVAAIVGEKRTYGAATSYGATFIGGGKMALTSKMQAMSIEFGGYQNDGEKTDLIADILSYAGKASGNENFVKKSDNLLGARWSKLAINAAFSGLSVVTGLTFGEVAKRKNTRKLALGILRECMDVAKASGVTLAPMQGHDMEKMLGGRTPFKRFIAYLVLPIAMKKHKKLVSGMLKDVQNGKKCEIDFIDGVVCREGARVGVKTPLCDKIVEIVHGIENGLYEIDYKNTDFFA
ncbi:MAG: 2-dehydropantoate 2-reductase [Clostridia bacterium]|nr:2-dehydropantoate 2-reductase [Clostridia bacterium]